MKYYTGVGSRQTPIPICDLMSRLAMKLQSMGWVLRTGDASGADAAFRARVVKREVYTPHSMGKGRTAPFEECWKYVQRLHPKPEALTGWYVQRLMARNSLQVLGPQLNEPSRFLVCWTQDGSKGATTRATGGTGQAIRLALFKGIPIYNLAVKSDLERVNKFMIPAS